ncbi:MAG TPA: cell division protein FtsZ [Bacteroidales bacterium]
MTNMITFEPKKRPSIIKVLGVGGGGSNAVKHMYEQGIEGVDFAICNTDLQALEASPVPIKIQLGDNGGLGAGSKPEVGKSAAAESHEKIRELLTNDTKMLFITAGMGGGTGTGAAPIIAEIAREMGILTVGIVTLPFIWEGRKRRQQAEAGVDEMKKHIDSLLVISNDKLREEYGDLGLSKAFAKADNVLTSAAKGIAELITVTGHVNIDFEDVKTVIEGSGKAIMGSATAEGEGRALRAIEDAMNSKLLNDNDIAGARSILLYIMTGNDEITMDEITEITDYIQQECGEGENSADVIWGNGVDATLENKIGITIIATGFEKPKTVAKPPTTTIGVVGNLDLKNETPAQPTGIPSEKEEPAEKESEGPKIVINNHDDSILKSHFIELKFKPSESSQAKQAEPAQDNSRKVHSLNEENDTIDSEYKKPEIKITVNENKNLAIKHTIGSNRFETQKESTTIHPSSKEELTESETLRQDRLNKLNNQSIFGRNSEMLSKMENEPAFRRKNIEINEPAHSSDSIVSRYTLSDDGNNNPVIKPDNSFLHDNPD